MWLWQRKNVRNRALLWAKLSTTSLFVHCILLSWLFFIYHDSTQQYTIAVHKTADYSAPIHFMPHAPTTTITQKSTAVHTKPTVVKQTPPKAITQKTEPKTTVSSKKETNTFASFDRLRTNGTGYPKTESNPVLTQPTLTLPLGTQKIKSNPIRQLNPSSLPSDGYPMETKLELGAKGYEHKKEQVSAPEQNPPSNAITSNNYREVEALRRGNQLQKELVQAWKPPVGVPHNCTCEIAFSVTSSGNVHDIKMMQSSGVIMYDVSARQALLSMKMPQWTHGKPLVISFKQ